MIQTDEVTKMPQTQIYLDNETYVKFLQVSEEERKRIRSEAATLITEEVNKTKKGGN